MKHNIMSEEEFNDYNDSLNEVKQLQSELTRLKSENEEYELNRKINLGIMENQEQEINRLKAEREKEIL